MKAVLNIERIGFNALKAHAKHDRREIGDQTHTDETRTCLNTSVGLHDCPEIAVREYLDKTGAKIDKRNETPITRLLLSASPEYFRPGRADQGGEFDRSRLRPWVRESINWLRKEFGEDVVHISTHLDETTPHIHAIVVPTYDKKTKRRVVKQVSHHKHPAFSGLNSYELLHDRYGDAVNALEIQRGDRLPDELRKRRSAKTKKEWLNGRIKAFSAQLSILDADIRKHLSAKLGGLAKMYRDPIAQTAVQGRANAALAAVRSKTKGRDKNDGPR